jgi:presequence protease
MLISLLTSGHSAPLQKALLDTNIGTDWSPNAGHHAIGQTAYVALGVQGVANGDEALVESEILRVLEDVAQTGFDDARIEGILHQMELGIKHKNANFGMSLLWLTTSSWFDGVDPIEKLLLTQRIERLRGEVAAGPFFQDLIRKYLLENPSRLVLTMRPDLTYDEKFKAKEAALLSEKVESLTEEGKKAVYEQGLALLDAQEETEDISVLPTLTVKDIPVKGETYPLEKEMVGQVPIQWRIAPTNGITYFTSLTSLNGLPRHLKPYVSLFADALSNLGTTKKSASEFEDEINLKTDGISGHVNVVTNHSGILSLFDFGSF